MASAGCPACHVSLPVLPPGATRSTALVPRKLISAACRVQALISAQPWAGKHRVPAGLHVLAGWLGRGAPGAAGEGSRGVPRGLPCASHPTATLKCSHIFAGVHWDSMHGLVQVTLPGWASVSPVTHEAGAWQAGLRAAMPLLSVGRSLELWGFPDAGYGGGGLDPGKAA